jgi:hypothetical protein
MFNILMLMLLYCHLPALGFGREGEVRFSAVGFPSQKMFRLKQMASTMVQTLSGTLNFDD